MKTTKRLISLFVGMLFATTMMADVVYEPMIVDSGFNRDVIKAVGSDTAISALYYSGSTSCFGTQSFIAQCNSAWETSDNANYVRTVRSGWSDNYRDTIRCTEDGDVYNNTLYKDVFWLLNPYTVKNALCIRPTKEGDENLPNSDQNKGFQGEGTLKFKKIGCYDRLFFLLVSLRKGSVNPRVVTTTVYYTDGTSTSTTFTLTGGLSAEAGHKVRMTNIYETTFNKNKIGETTTAYAMVFDIGVNHTKLIDHIHFSNPINNSSVTILAVTGRTADIAAPDEESTEVEDIQNHQFTISWDGVPEAETYRVDVATDEDFQNMVEGYNNKEVSKTDTVVTGLDEDEDYYWRVRSVNADGGQSASSAPRRVRTAGSNPPETSETSENIEEMLAGYAGYRAVVPQLKIHRTLCRNGYFNTLCLPFSMNAGQIAVSPLAGIRVFEFVSAEKHDGLDIVISGPIDHIDAGVPYLVNWEPTTPEWIGTGEDGLVFENVNITTYKGDTIGDNEHVQFIGNIGIANLVELDQNNLFLGANNTLYWPEGGNRLKGFRSYFEIPSSGAQAVARHTPARIVTRKETPTDLDHVQRDNVPCTKVLRNGQLIIFRDGKRYNVLGEEL